MTTAAMLRGMLGLAALTVLAAGASGEIVRLKDGKLVHGEIVDFDEGLGVTMHRSDNGGVVKLRWDHLPADEVRRIKRARGFTGEDAEPYMVDVVHLVMRNGTTESGVRLEDERSGFYTLRRRGSNASFPGTQVRSVESGRMEGLAIFTPDELYRRLTEEVGAAVDAPSHFKLAVACEGAKLYADAMTHYQAVQELDPDLKSDLVSLRVAHIAIKIEDAAETDALDEIRARLYRKQFEQAYELVDAFRATYPDSRQASDVLALETQIDQRKREHYAGKIISNYFDLLDRRLANVGRDSEIDLDTAREIAETAIHPGILTTLAELYTMSEETVGELWQARKGGSVRSYSYGTGTFILGKQRALEFGRFDGKEDKDAAADAEAEDEMDDLVEQIKRRRTQKAEEQRNAARAKSAAEGEGLDPEEWWEQSSSEDKIAWLKAYYAESAGVLTVSEARGRHCRRCDAKGYIELFNEKGEVVRATCPVCKDIKYERFVRCR